MSGGTKGSNKVDADVQLAIEESRNAIISKVEGKIGEAISEIKGHIDLKVKPVERDVENLQNCVSAIDTRVGVLEQYKAREEGKDAGAGTERNTIGKNVQIKAGLIGLFITILLGLGAFVGWLFKNLNP